MVRANRLLQVLFQFLNFLGWNHMELFVSWLIKQISMGITVILGGEFREWSEGKKGEKKIKPCSVQELSSVSGKDQPEESVPPALDLCHSH